MCHRQRRDADGRSRVLRRRLGRGGVVGSPGASTQRNVKFLSIRNTHATSSNVITLQHYDGTTTTTLIKFTLKAGYSMTYNDVEGWGLYDSSGGKAVTPLTGRFLGTSVLTSASANFTTGPETNTIFVRGVAGGGGAEDGDRVGELVERRLEASPVEAEEEDVPLRLLRLQERVAEVAGGTPKRRLRSLRTLRMHTRAARLGLAA